MDQLGLHIEALIFCAPESVSIEEIQSGLQELFDSHLEISSIKEAIDQIKQKFSEPAFSFELVESGGGYQFLTKPSFQPVVESLLKQKIRKRLSTSALETLSIIAYKQPVSRPQLEQIRGVNCDYAIQKLLDKELIVIQGKSDQPGKPVLYGTSRRFMDHFGINSLNQLPELKDIAMEENTIGESAE